MPTPRVSLAVAALVVGIFVTMSAGSFSDLEVSAPNAINNATHDGRTMSPSPGTYDPDDPYEPQLVFPQLGWQNLPRLPS